MAEWVGSMNLYQITAEYRAQLAALQDLDLPPEVVADTVEGLQGDIESKLRAVLAYSLELEIQETGASEAAKRMQDRAKSLSSRVSGLRAYALRAMQEAGISDVSTSEFAAKVAKTPAAVKIAEGTKLPAEFVRTKTTTEPDRTALKAAIQGGREVAGVELVSGYRLALK